MYKLNRYLIAFFSLAAFASCEDNSMNDPQPIAVGARRASCSTLNYGDSLFHLRDDRKDYVISPGKNLRGTFGATPNGLHINPATGDINISKSETGLRYRVFFVPTNSKDTCSQYLTVSGIDYLSKIYKLSSGDTLLKPVYNGRRDQSLPCGEGNNGADGCEFDTDGDVGELKAATQGIAINKKNAIINLKRTLRNGAFGANPENGTAQVAKIYYRINDSSRKARNFIKVKFIYYATTRDIPAGLKNQIRTENARMAASPTAPSTLPVAYSEDGRPVRPPIIVIVGH